MQLSLADSLDEEIDCQGIQLLEYDFPDGVNAAYFKSSRMSGPVIAISKKIQTTGARNLAKAHELAHHFTCPADLLSLPPSSRRKFENIANRRMLERVMPLGKLISAVECGARSLSDLSEYLEISEEGIVTGLAAYREIYGEARQVGLYRLTFDPFNIFPLYNAV